MKSGEAYLPRVIVKRGSVERAGEAGQSPGGYGGAGRRAQGWAFDPGAGGTRPRSGRGCWCPAAAAGGPGREGGRRGPCADSSSLLPAARSVWATAQAREGGEARGRAVSAGKSGRLPGGGDLGLRLGGQSGLGRSGWEESRSRAAPRSLPDSGLWHLSSPQPFVRGETRLACGLRAG